ncbi:nickel pincer cofactor biosynthesis protein LarB [Bacteroidota bacterium]
MDFDKLFDDIKKGKISKKEARKRVNLDLLNASKSAVLDINRGIRTGIPEIVYGEYKTKEQVIEIVENILQKHENVIVSRFVDNDKLANHFRNQYPVYTGQNIFVAGKLPESNGHVLVVSGGTADHPISEEVELTLKAMGVNPLVYEDRGIAHPTRVHEAIEEGIQKNIKVAVVIAGFEGALATYVSSLLSVPVIGVPTSVGYGYRSNESAFLAMLSSCMPNLAIVNIDGGIRAAVIASLITKNSEK